jgi:nickel-dependent lactate racemase
MKYKLGFGKDMLGIEIDDKDLLGVMQPNDIKIETSEIEEVRRAVRQPIDSNRLKDIVKPGEKVVIITSDITRPMPSKKVLSEILNELYDVGISKKDIKIVFGMGSHRKHTEQEQRYLVGDEIYEQIECLDSDVDDCVFMGETSFGTPVNIFRPVAEADRRICLGNIEYHYFAGYSGGAKAIMPGVSNREAIQANHSKMVMAEAKAGEILSNPVRQDIDEVAKFVSIDFILNVILDEHKTIIKAVAGHHIAAHREGCEFLDKLYKVQIAQQADIVIVSPGGYPKDINLYQAQKALDNSKHAVKDGGVVILVASCKEGLGEHVFETWMLGAQSSEEMIEKIQQHFELGGHKAAAIAMILEKCDIYLVSDLDAEFVKKLFMKPFKDIERAYNEAIKKTGISSKVYLMPYGGSTLPVLIP